MAKFRVGCVPYVNAIPLIFPFVNNPDSPVEVVFDVPSQLPKLHEAGEVDCILVSSIDSLRHPNAQVVNGVCIGSNGPVESVRLFSRVAYGLIQTLALDQSSMTSNALAQILLREGYGAQPNCIAFPPDLEVMLDVCDAAVIIGDKGLTAQYPGARILDLGQAWTDSYDAPFVWALWTSYRNINPELAQILQSAISEFDNNPEETYQYAAQTSGWNMDLVRRYLSSCVKFPFGPDQQRGLQLYAEKLSQNNIIPTTAFPQVVA